MLDISKCKYQSLLLHMPKLPGSYWPYSLDSGKKRSVFLAGQEKLCNDENIIIFIDCFIAVSE